MRPDLTNDPFLPVNESVLVVLVDCRGEAYGQRQPGQRGDHSDSVRRPQQPGRTGAAERTRPTRSACTPWLFFIKKYPSCRLLKWITADVLHVCIPGGGHLFSDLRDDDSLFSKFFGGFKWHIKWNISPDWLPFSFCSFLSMSVP